MSCEVPTTKAQVIAHTIDIQKEILANSAKISKYIDRLSEMLESSNEFRDINGSCNI